MNICIAVCTMNREKQLEECLMYLSEQKKYITQILLVEDISYGQSFSIKKLNSIFHPVKNRRITVKYCNLSKSRQRVLFELKKEKFNGVLVFIDDDVQISSKYFEKLKKIHKEFPMITSFVGPVLPKHNNPLSIAQSIYYNDNYIYDKKIQEITMFPSSLVTFKFSEIQKNNLKFDERFVYGQDIDFYLHLTEMKKKTYFHPALYCSHDFSTTFLQFLKKRFLYSQYTGLLHKIHPVTLPVDQYLPQRKIHVFFLIVFIFWFSFRNTRYLLKISHTSSLTIGWYLFCNELMSIFGLYFSREGTVILFKKIYSILMSDLGKI